MEKRKRRSRSRRALTERQKNARFGFSSLMGTGGLLWVFFNARDPIDLRTGVTDSGPGQALEAFLVRLIIKAVSLGGRVVLPTSAAFLISRFAANSVPVAGVFVLGSLLSLIVTRTFHVSATHKPFEELGGAERKVLRDLRMRFSALTVSLQTALEKGRTADAKLWRSLWNLIPDQPLDVSGRNYASLQQQNLEQEFTVKMNVARKIQTLEPSQQAAIIQTYVNDLGRALTSVNEAYTRMKKGYLKHERAIGELRSLATRLETAEDEEAKTEEMLRIRIDAGEEAVTGLAFAQLETARSARQRVEKELEDKEFQVHGTVEGKKGITSEAIDEILTAAADFRSAKSDLARARNVWKQAIRAIDPFEFFNFNIDALGFDTGSAATQEIERTKAAISDQREALKKSRDTLKDRMEQLKLRQRELKDVKEDRPLEPVVNALLKRTMNQYKALEATIDTFDPRSTGSIKGPRQYLETAVETDLQERNDAKENVVQAKERLIELENALFYHQKVAQTAEFRLKVLLDASNRAQQQASEQFERQLTNCRHLISKIAAKQGAAIEGLERQIEKASVQVKNIRSRQTGKERSPRAHERRLRRWLMEADTRSGILNGALRQLALVQRECDRLNNLPDGDEDIYRRNLAKEISPYIGQQLSAIHTAKERPEILRNVLTIALHTFQALPERDRHSAANGKAISAAVFVRSLPSPVRKQLADTYVKARNKRYTELMQGQATGQHIPLQYIQHECVAAARQAATVKTQSFAPGLHIAEEVRWEHISPPLKRTRLVSTT